MLKRIHRSLFFCTLILSGCGGSTPENLASKYSLVLTATPYINAMPSALVPGQTAPCTSLIVLFEVTSKTLTLPNGMVPKTVSIQKNGTAIWSQAVSATETNLINNQTLKGVARGCSPDGISVGETLELRFLIATENSEIEIPASAKLSIVY